VCRYTRVCVLALFFSLSQAMSLVFPFQSTKLFFCLPFLFEHSSPLPLSLILMSSQAPSQLSKSSLSQAATLRAIHSRLESSKQASSASNGLGFQEEFRSTVRGCSESESCSNFSVGGKTRDQRLSKVLIWAVDLIGRDHQFGSLEENRKRLTLKHETRGCGGVETEVACRKVTP
jgi:hypothetical protein